MTLCPEEWGSCEGNSEKNITFRRVQNKDFFFSSWLKFCSPGLGPEAAAVAKEFSKGNLFPCVTLVESWTWVGKDFFFFIF